MEVFLVISQQKFGIYITNSKIFNCVQSLKFANRLDFDTYRYCIAEHIGPDKEMV